MKLCIHCKYYNKPQDDIGLCMRITEVSPVDGLVKHILIPANLERAGSTHVVGLNSGNPCGPDGKHWVEAEPVAPPNPLKEPVYESEGWSFSWLKNLFKSK